jgi:hypothetical protein
VDAFSTDAGKSLSGSNLGGRKRVAVGTKDSALLIDLDQTTAAAGELMIGLMIAHDHWEETGEEFEEWMREMEAMRRAGIPDVPPRRTQPSRDRLNDDSQA